MLLVFACFYMLSNNTIVAGYFYVWLLHGVSNSIANIISLKFAIDIFM